MFRNRDKFLFVQSIIGVNVTRNGDKLGLIFQEFEKKSEKLRANAFNKCTISIFTPKKYSNMYFIYFRYVINLIKIDRNLKVTTRPKHSKSMSFQRKALAFLPHTDYDLYPNFY